jgi:hypothetical protein
VASAAQLACGVEAVSTSLPPGRKRQVFWQGAADKCEFCEKPIAQEVGTKIVDGRTRDGPWALMDMACHKLHGVGTGTGHGQVYQRQTDGRWLKIEG